MPIDPKNISKLRDNQDMLRNEITNLERNIVREGGKQYGSDEEVKDMLTLLLKENKRLNERIDYILKMLSEATDYSVEEASERVLATMAKSQIEVLEQLYDLQEKIKQKQPPEEQQKTVELLGKKFQELSDAISHLPYPQQINVLSADVKHIDEDVKDLEALVTTQEPDEARLDIEALKNSIEGLKAKIDELQNSVKRIGTTTAQPKAAPNMAQLDELSAKISGIDVKINELDSLLQKRREDVSGADMGKIEELGARIRDMGDEIHKMEKWTETYPAGDSQQITFMKDRFASLEKEIIELKQSAPEREALEALGAKLDSLEETFKGQKLDRERTRESDIKIIIAMLDKMAKEIEKIESQDTRHIEEKLSGLEQKTREMERGMRRAKDDEAKKAFFVALGKDMGGFERDAADAHEHIARERPVDAMHITELKEDVQKTRARVQSVAGSEVKPEKVMIVRETLKDLKVPPVAPMEPLAKESVSATRESLGALSEEAPAQVKKKIESAAVKVGNIESELRKAEDSMLETKEKMREVKEHAGDFAVTDEDRVFQYVVKMPMNKDMPLEDIARDLSMSQGDVERVLRKLSKEDPRIVLQNTGYASKVLGKPATVMKTTAVK